MVKFLDGLKTGCEGDSFRQQRLTRESFVRGTLRPLILEDGIIYQHPCFCRNLSEPLLHSKNKIFHSYLTHKKIKSYPCLINLYFYCITLFY